MSLSLFAQSLFVVVEGVDGVGKTTYIAKLKQALEAKKINVVVVEQFSHPDTKGLRQTLVANNCLTHPERSYLVALDRSVNARQVIKPALAQHNTIVIADRWTPSTYVYGGNNIDWVAATNQGITTDVLLLLELPVFPNKPVATQGQTEDCYDSEPMAVRRRRDAMYADVKTMVRTLGSPYSPSLLTQQINAFTQTEQAFDQLVNTLQYRLSISNKA